MIPADTIEEVRRRADLERLVGHRVRLNRRGRAAWGLCPFHGERTPSFKVEGGRFHCFGCGADGDTIEWVRRTEGLDFADAVRHLAGQVGVQVPTQRPSTPEDRAKRDHRRQLLTVNRFAATFYARCLERYEPAMRYLVEERGLTEETIRKWGLGWAPSGYRTLADLLERKGLGVELGREAGLLGLREGDPRPYDRLRGRVVFPIEARAGVVAFGGRQAEWVSRKGPKYLNTAGSPVYEKGAVLFGLPQALPEIRRTRRAVLVEGYFDVLALHQAGLASTVAACGTALTTAHARVLAQVAEEVVTVYDGDPAGLEASHRAAQVMLAEGLRVRVVALPGGEDPDTFVRAEPLAPLVEAAAAVVEFWLDRAQLHPRREAEARRTALERVWPLLQATNDPAARDLGVAAARAVAGTADEGQRKPAVWNRRTRLQVIRHLVHTGILK